MKENIQNSAYLRNSKLNKRRGAEIIKAALESINIKDEIKDARSLVNNNSLTNLNLIKIPRKNTYSSDSYFRKFPFNKDKP